MRLLTHDSRGELGITRDLSDANIQPYAILSHTWGKEEEEVMFHEVGTSASTAKAGFAKIKFCGEQTRRDGWQHFWVDTCCIDKASHTEVSKAITSMYRWYQNAQVCYVYLADVSLELGEDGRKIDHSWKPSFRKSRWFRRGWTLQELLAPKEVVFYAKDWQRLGTKSELQNLIHSITGIDIAALNARPLSEFSVIERMRWTHGRETKEKEDQAYCLLGIFDVYMYLNYGEGDNAFRRLQREIDAKSRGDSPTNIRDHPVNAQTESRSLGLCLASAPLIQSHEFVGRAVEIEAIHNILQPDSPVEQRRVVLGGLGGMGKTQLAFAYARQHTRSYASVLWLNATTPQTLSASFRSVAELLITANELEQLDDQQILARVRGWLSRSYNTSWLLIFDNYDDPDLDQFNIDDFTPNTAYGSVIVTTRLPDKVTGSQVRVQPLSAIDDSLAILRIRSGRANTEDDAGARRLAERMAGLPLALATAGAYLRKTTLSFQTYLEVYEKRWQVDPRRQLRLHDYQDRTLYNTWTLSHNRLKAEDVQAAQMLRLFAYFDHQEVWFELLQAGLSARSPHWLTEALSDRMVFESVMNTLVDYCFVEVQYSTQSYRMHECVHDWTVAALNANIDTQLLWYAVDCVAAKIDKGDLNTLRELRYMRLSPHGAWLAHLLFERCDQLDSNLLNQLQNAAWIACMLREQDQLSLAEQIFVRVLAAVQTALGPGHISTFETMYELGVLYQSQGNLQSAEQMLRQALVGKEIIIGLDHISTINNLTSLGLVYWRQSRLDEAEQIYTQALARIEKAPGRYNKATLVIIHNLGLLYETYGRRKEAEQMLMRALTGYEKVLRPEDLSILDIVNDLGVLYTRESKYDMAEQMFTRVLAEYERALGPDHPLTADAANSLGTLYFRQNRLEDAEQAFTKVLTRKPRDLERGHSSTLGTIHNLGLLYNKQGRLEEAERMYERVPSAYPDGSRDPRERGTVSGQVQTLSKGIYLHHDDQLSIPRTWLVRFLQHIEQRGNNEEYAISQVVKALIYLREDRDAWLTYSLSFVDSNGTIVDPDTIICDGCDEYISISSGRAVCRQCEDIDLCDKCMPRYRANSLAVPECNGHEFCDVGTPAAEALRTHAFGDLKMDAWLAQLKRKTKLKLYSY